MNVMEEKPRKQWQRKPKEITSCCIALAQLMLMVQTTLPQFSPEKARKELIRIAALCGKYVAISINCS